MDTVKYICEICGHGHPTEAHPTPELSLESSPENQSVSDIDVELEEVFGSTQTIKNRENYAKVESENKDIAKSIENVLKHEVVPNTYDLFSGEEGYRQQVKRLKEHNINDDPPTYASKKRGRELFAIGSLLLGRRISQENTSEDLRQAFEGKKVLVFGDDVGTLSEVINRLGGVAYGIEYDHFKVETAHLGVWSEDGSPQTQVIHGNLLDMAYPDSELMKQVKELGPFDIIYSKGVLNGGSGFRERGGKHYRQNTPNTESHSFLAKVLDTTDEILTDDGKHLHMDVDDGDFSRVGYLSEGIKNSVMKKYGLPPLGIPGLGIQGNLITRKGLIKKLGEEYPNLVRLGGK